MALNKATGAHFLLGPKADMEWLDLSVEGRSGSFDRFEQDSVLL
jgi:hypothetical protein